MKRLCLALLLALLFTASAFAAVDLNTATKEQLDSLPGIGPKKAEAIIKHRDEKGGFKSIEEIKEVSGIGEKIFHGLKNEVTVGLSAAEKDGAESAKAAEGKPAAAEVKPAEDTPVKPDEKAAAPNEPKEKAKEAAAEEKK